MPPARLIHHQFTPQEDELVFSLRKKNLAWKTITKLMNQEWQAIHGRRPDGNNEFSIGNIIFRYLKYSHSHEEWKEWESQKYQYILGNWVEVGADYPILCKKNGQQQRQCRQCVSQFIKTIVNSTIRGIQTKVLQSQHSAALLNNLITTLGKDSKNKYCKLTKKLRMQLFTYIKCKMRSIQVPISKQVQFYIFIGKFAQLVEQISIYHPLKKNPNKYYRWSDQQIKNLLEFYNVHGRWICKIRQDLINMFGVHEKYSAAKIASKIRTFVMLGLRTLQEQLNKIGKTLGFNIYGHMIVSLTNGITPQHIEKNMKIIQLFLDRQEFYSDEYLLDLKQHFLQEVIRQNRRHWRQNYIVKNKVWVEVEQPQHQQSYTHNTPQ